MAGRENIPLKVYCRLSPCDHESCLESVTDNCIKIRYHKANQLKSCLYTFSRVFDHGSSQATVYEETVSPLVSELLIGNSSLVFTYGISGSGKTHTMFGSLKNPGIVIRSLDSIFNSLEYLLAPKYCLRSDGCNTFLVQSETEAIQMKQKLEYNENMRSTKYASRYADREIDSTRHIVAKGYRYAVFVSFYELYNNTFVDLLAPSTNPHSSKVKLNIREDIHRNVFVSGLTEVEIRSTEEGMHLLEIGRKRRHTAGTNLNHDSSRSHSIFCLKLVRCNVDSRYDEVNVKNPDVKISQICLVDLAGSERTNRALTKGERLKEASSINNTLMTLRKCIDVLRFNQKTAGRPSPPLTGSVSSLDSSGIASSASNNGKISNQNQKIVPYRDSKLTHIFKAFFEGDGSVRMIVCVKPLARESDELVHVLNFAEATQTVSTVRYIQELTPPDYNVSSMDLHDTSVLNSAKKTSCLKSITSKMGLISSGTLSAYDQTLNDRLDLLLETGSDYLRVLDRNMRAGEDFVTRMIAHAEAEERNLSKAEFDELSDSSDELSSEELKADAERSEKLLKFFAPGEEEELYFNSLIEAMEMNRERCRMNLYKYFTERLEKASSGEAKKKNFIEKNKIIETKPRVPEKGFVNSISRQFESKFNQKRPTPYTPVSSMATSSEARMSRTINQYSSTAKRVPINPRFNKDTGEHAKWLEHTEKDATPLGTIFKAKLRRSRSTSRPNLTDTLNATNYLLHHQECTPNGELETRLYKGDIIPTAGGGASVIFNDVEELRQYSPGNSRKYQSPTCCQTPANSQIRPRKSMSTSRLDTLANKENAYTNKQYASPLMGIKRSSVVALGSENFNHHVEEELSSKRRNLGDEMDSKLSSSILVGDDLEYFNQISLP